ncbi:MAG: hypothetical protein WAQ98_05360, partial [Blastocatellia bacterium]
PQILHSTFSSTLQMLSLLVFYCFLFAFPQLILFANFSKPGIAGIELGDTPILFILLILGNRPSLRLFSILLLLAT